MAPQPKKRGRPKKQPQPEPLPKKTATKPLHKLSDIAKGDVEPPSVLKQQKSAVIVDPNNDLAKFGKVPQGSYVHDPRAEKAPSAREEILELDLAEDKASGTHFVDRQQDHAKLAKRPTYTKPKPRGSAEQ
jgi:hypothetical protein